MNTHPDHGATMVLDVLNVAEKPSVARALAEAFGRMPGSQDAGMQRQANQVFTHRNVIFPSVRVQGNGQLLQQPMEPHNMTTTSVRGHLASIDFPEEYGWGKCDPSVLFDAPIETFYKNDMKPLEQMLRTLARRTNYVILWLDCDREGEAIGDEVEQVCLEGNPSLAGKVLRARFSTVLPNEIQRALQTLTRLDYNAVGAVKARSELDLRVGAAFTRFQTLFLQRRFEGFNNKGVVSYGPCQFPTLGFVVERWARIQTFVPENFWYLELTLHPDESPSPIPFRWKRERLYDHIMTLALYEQCLDNNTEAMVASLDGRPRNKWRPVPLATTELQKRASRFLHMGSQRLMDVAEQLYQQGLISK